MTFFQNFVGSLLVSAIIFAFLFVAAFLIVLRLIKRGSGLFMKFWGADIYTFNLQKRMQLVFGLAWKIALVPSVLFFLLAIFM